MNSKQWERVFAALALGVPMAQIAQANTFLTEAQLPKLFFPGFHFKTRSITLTDDQKKKIEDASGESVNDPQLHVLVGEKGQAIFIDRVVGKHEFITYAVAIASNRTVKGIEIMDYRETYGYEVRRPEWRRQFIGKSVHDPLTLEKDIQNISGATLSSAHVTNGVRRIMITYDVIKPAH